MTTSLPQDTAFTFRHNPQASPSQTSPFSNINLPIFHQPSLPAHSYSSSASSSHGNCSHIPSEASSLQCTSEKNGNPEGKDAELNRGEEERMKEEEFNSEYGDELMWQLKHFHFNSEPQTGFMPYIC
eukprot:TRINITY_DN3525_c0_g1_i2.p1 TRINITY_DN3525_c0_g1~~TRINITY_DN3525_c0_g1_i2.p1  ORF type:complete len:138 (+),score=38.60 TRINITY_DN3525_c0_g1_i2:35-415(+)